jgi:DNA modification methylase
MLIHGSARRLPLRDGSVHCVVTSPPFFGLRVYKGVEPSTWADGWRGLLGNEPSPALYVAHIVEVFREVRRVLRDDGTCWLELGDSFAGTGGFAKSENDHGMPDGTGETPVGKWQNDYGAAKPLDLLGIPWAVAFALRDDGWYLRSDVVWAKKGCMPESISGWAWQQHRSKVAPAPDRTIHDARASGTGNRRESSGPVAQQPHAVWEDCPGCEDCEKNDGLVLRRGSWRPTRSHSFIFLLAKSDSYYCDADAVREPHTSKEQNRTADGGSVAESPMWTEVTGGGPPHRGLHRVKTAESPHAGGRRQAPEPGEPGAFHPAGRNQRDVWHLATTPTPDAHFATFTEEIPRRAILAGTSAKGVCPACGAPWARVVLREIGSQESSVPDDEYARESGGHSRSRSPTVMFRQAMSTRRATSGWRATCACPPAEPVPAVVLDPFVGSGTTVRVAHDLGRLGIGLDASFHYLDTIARRKAGGGVQATLGDVL